MSKPRLLLFCDYLCPTGFARVSTNLLPFFLDAFDVSICAINYFGDVVTPPPCPLYRAALGGTDPYGIGRYQSLVSLIDPDVVFATHDPWVLKAFLAQHAKLPDWPTAERPRFIAYTAIDGLHVPSAPVLNAADLVIAYTHFGATELRTGGYTGPLAVIPHGVDLGRYQPQDQQEARAHLGVSQLDGKIVIGNLNRNQPRKRLDVLLMGFAQWRDECHLEDQAYLWLHCANEDVGWNLKELARYLGIGEYLIMPPPEMAPHRGAEESELPWLYSAWDVQATATLGEGWGLSTMEAMACGCPNLVPRWSALAEWADGAVEYMPVTMALAGIEHGNIGGLVTPATVARALAMLVPDAPRLAYLRAAGQALVAQPQYRWEAIAQRFIDAIGLVLEGLAHEANTVPSISSQVIEKEGV